MNLEQQLEGQWRIQDDKIIVDSIGWYDVKTTDEELLIIASDLNIVGHTGKEVITYLKGLLWLT